MPEAVQVPVPRLPAKRPLTAARDAARDLTVAAHLAGDGEILRAAVADAAFLDHDDVTIGTVAGALLGHDFDAPRTVEGAGLGLRWRNKGRRRYQYAHTQQLGVRSNHGILPGR
ncbi:hypothetical protein [Microvirga sp. 17 mud 1-3]|uniref:hypothetical protein n=1 Tax=Microvirga sp. 17 mud 1-3 TaxID=2082949 RepID=UPI0013A57BBF|nr:hypothetical protein [Microvirga sp. 17 mud 1-3]